MVGQVKAFTIQPEDAESEAGHLQKQARMGCHKLYSYLYTPAFHKHPHPQKC